MLEEALPRIKAKEFQIGPITDTLPDITTGGSFRNSQHRTIFHTPIRMFWACRLIPTLNGESLSVVWDPIRKNIALAWCFFKRS